MSGMSDAGSASSPTVPPWERRNVRVPKPTISDYGYVENGQAVSCTEQELIDRCGDKEKPIVQVWVPEHEHVVTIFEAPSLFEKIRRLETALTRTELVKAVAISAGGVIVWRMVGEQMRMMVLLMTAIFGVMPAIQHLWQMRYLATMKPETMAKWPSSIRYQAWMQEQVAPLTNMVLGGLILIFIGQLAAGRDHSLYLAALNRSAVEAGEHWRMCTATLLHGGTIHILFNGMALHYLGRPVEVLVGKAAFVITFVFSMLLGAFFSLMTMPPNVPSVGASGGILGLLGFLIVFGFRYRRIMPNGFTKNLMANVVFIACLGIALRDMIDNGAHLGGLIGGLLCGVVLIPRGGTQVPVKPLPGVNIAGWIALGYLVLAAVFTLYRLSSGWSL